jgi:Mg2+/Co2+ transporter CorC
MVEKMTISSYNNTMAYRDIFIKETNQDRHSGEDIHAVIDSVHKDYDKSKKYRSDIEGTIYYRDLLSFLIKTYGH